MKLFTNEQLYDKSQVCARLMISLSKLDRMMASNDIPYLKLGGSVRFRGEALNDFMLGCKA